MHLYYVLNENIRRVATMCQGVPGGSVAKNLPANVGEAGLVPGLGRSPGGGNGNPLQCSCPENPVDRGVWRATLGHKESDMTS